jgi:hypothetical protein
MYRGLPKHPADCYLYADMVNELLPVVLTTPLSVFGFGNIQCTEFSRHRARLTATNHGPVNLDNGHHET